MRTLEYNIDLEKLEQIKDDIVPTLFTMHQFSLIQKKMSGKQMSASEKCEFSRAISKKMKAIYKILGQDTGNIFVYGKEKIRKDRLNKSIGYIKRFERNFKNRHIIISGSFLYTEFKDIDVFVISKYQKKNYRQGKFHINYLKDDVYHSLFYKSLKQLCVSNRAMENYNLEEQVTIDTVISLYQELFHDITEDNASVKFTARQFLMQTAFISQSPCPDSFDLRQKVEKIIKSKKPLGIVRNIFVGSLIQSKEDVIRDMKQMVKKYSELGKEYKQHKEYYTDIIEAFNEVIEIES